MKHVITQHKKLAALATVVALAALVAAMWYSHARTQTSCISYYGKDGKQPLYQDCK